MNTEKTVQPSDAGLESSAPESLGSGGSSDILNEAERKALMDNGADAKGNLGKWPFLMSEQDKMALWRMPTLDKINERFVRNIKKSLGHIMKRTVDVHDQGISIWPYAEYLKKLDIPSSIQTMTMHPLEGTGLVVLDHHLVYIFVDNFFDGSGRFVKKNHAIDFTPSEMRLIHLFSQQLVQDMEEAWSAIQSVKMDLQAHESNPSLVTGIADEELLVINSFEMILEGGEGLLQIVYPYPMIAPLKEQAEKVAPVKEKMQEQWVHAIKNELLEVPLELEVSLTEVTMRLWDMVRLAPRDIIPIEFPESVVLRVNGIPSFHAKVGVHEEHVAVKIIDRMQRPS